jgi:hypothetical protein
MQLFRNDKMTTALKEPLTGAQQKIKARTNGGDRNAATGCSQHQINNNQTN